MTKSSPREESNETIDLSKSNLANPISESEDLGLALLNGGMSEPLHLRQASSALGLGSGALREQLELDLREDKANQQGFQSTLSSAGVLSASSSPREAGDASVVNLPQSLSKEEALEILRPRVALSPNEYQQALEFFVSDRRGTESSSQASDAQSGSLVLTGSGRPSYNGSAAQGTDKFFEDISGCGVYNRPYNGKSNVSLGWREFDSVRASIHAYYATNPTTVMLPFAVEPDTAKANVNYAMEVVGASNVIAITADLDEVSRSEVGSTVADTGASLISQRKVLDCIDWNKVCGACGIPLFTDPDTGAIRPPNGAKGLTMWAGVLYAHATGRLTEQMAAFHDTDIINPWHYDALTYLGLPHVLPPENGIVRAVHIAKSGEGRNNQIVTIGMNRVARNKDLSPHVRQMARIASTLIWPLTGERMSMGQDLYKMPWATGMSIETQMDLYFSAGEVINGRSEIQQVCNGITKRENAAPSPVREFALMDRCESWSTAFSKFCSELNIFPQEIATQHIYIFNELYGGLRIDGLYQSEHDDAQEHTSIYTDYLLPSLEQLDELKAVDWAQIKDVGLISGGQSER